MPNYHKVNFYKLASIILLQCSIVFHIKLVAQDRPNEDSLIIRNFSSTHYFASAVNYSGLTLSDNTILFANDRGLLIYDGTQWNLKPIRNDSKVISLYDADTAVFVGGDDEFGYFKRNDLNEFEFFSLRNQVNDSITLDKFFQIVPLGDNIYFQSYEQVFNWDGNSVSLIPINNAHIFNVENRLIASAYGKGLYEIDDNNNVLPVNTKFRFQDDAAFTILKTSEPQKHLVFTSDNGGYILNMNNYSTTPWNTEVSELFRKDGFYYGTHWLDSLYVATTWDGGVVVFNEKGKIITFIDKSTGITGKYLRELFVDNRNKLWITSDIGLSEIYWPAYDTLSSIYTHIQSLSINDKLYSIQSIADTCVNENANLKFTFVTPGFEKGEVLYSHRLKGFDKAWSPWSVVNTKEFTQLKGGKYILELKAKSKSGIESPSIASYTFSVRTPWFKTTWAYLLYTVASIALIALITWSRTLRLKIMNKRLERIINSRTKEIMEKSQALEIANESLKVKNQELDNFVYRSSHDLIAPLKSLKGLIHIAKSDNSVDNQLEYLQHMEKSVLKLEDFIKSILDFATNIKTETRKVEVNLEELVSDIAYDLEYYEQAKDIELRRLLDITTFKTEPKRLRIILSNLLANAVKYHNFDQENPCVEIKAYSNGNGKTTLEITDNGQGIKEEYLPNIFDMFFRANNTSEGSGLGLYIVKDMITRLDGTISVSSTYGKGTTFTLSFN